MAVNGSGLFAAVMTAIAAFLFFLAILSPTEMTTEYGTPTINGVPCEKVSDEKFICRLPGEVTP